MVDLKSFYSKKRVLLTGHTGFKGSWMSVFLNEIGAIVQGYALEPLGQGDLFLKASVGDLVIDFRGDVLDYDRLKKLIDEFQPEIVFHLAAQPLVIESYNSPKYTWEVNVTGTLNLLEILRNSDSVKSIVIVTTDKVYKNLEKVDGYVEEDQISGYDPYSSSKAAVEILVESMYNSFFLTKHIGLATARSGNVIGGGDWSKNRLIPDYYRAYLNKTSFELRNPLSVRPWQHVLDVIYGYLILAMEMYHNPEQYSGAWNFGPFSDSLTTKEIIDRLNANRKLEIVAQSIEKKVLHETIILKLNSSKSSSLLKWHNILDINKSLSLIDEFYINFQSDDLKKLFKSQVKEYINLIEDN